MSLSVKQNKTVSTSANVKRFVLLVLIIFACFSAFAGEREGKLELDSLMFANSGQHIIYDFGMYSEQKSIFGAGTQIGFKYNLFERFAAGVNIGYEFFLYKDFHDYHDIKLTAEMRLRVNRLKNKFFNWHVNFKVGTDYVIRDDKAVSLYYLHGFGTSVDFRIRDNMFFTVGSDMEVTLQIGSDVSHFNHYMGVTWIMDEKYE